MYMWIQDENVFIVVQFYDFQRTMAHYGCHTVSL